MRHAWDSAGVCCSSAHTRRSSSRMRASCWASSRFRLLSFSSSSSSFRSFRFSRRRKETVVASTSSPPASDATTRRGASPAERRTVRSLRCGPRSRRLPGRTPQGVEASVPVGRRAARAPLPPRPWPSSVPLGRCGA